MDKDILLSVAHCLMLEECRKEGIDCSGTHIEKLNPLNRNERVYGLVKDEGGECVMKLHLRRACSPVYLYKSTNRNKTMTEDEAHKLFGEWINERYPFVVFDNVKIDTARVLDEMHFVAYSVEFKKWVDSKGITIV